MNEFTTYAGKSVAGTKQQSYRWSILALLFVVTTINYIDRQVIGLLKPVISGDLGWSEADYGYIVSAFQGAYAIGLLFSGRLLDRFGTRIGYSVAVALWSLAGVAHAAAMSVLSFGTARFFLGLGESANFPAAVKTVSEWFPQKERAFATGLFNSGSTFGAIVAPVIVTSITLALGWQWAFIITGSIGFVWVFLWLVFYRKPFIHPSRASLTSSSEGKLPEPGSNANSLTWKKILTCRPSFAICLSRFVTDWVWWFFLFWTPDYLHKTYGINLSQMVLPLIVIYTVAGLGGIAGGWLSGFFIRKGKSVDYARKTTILICALAVLPIIAVSKVSNIWLVVGAISLATAAHQGWASNIFTIVPDIFPENAVASVVGLSGFAGAIGGTLSAAFVGFVLEITNSYFYIFLMAGLAYLVAWIILKAMIPRISRITVPD
jgi:ACS family hexuronate transporter-like MFS transporter